MFFMLRSLWYFKIKVQSHHLSSLQVFGERGKSCACGEAVAKAMMADGSASLPESAAAAWRIGNDIGVGIDEEERGSSSRGSKRRMDRERPEELVISQSPSQSQSQLRNDGKFSQSVKNVFGKLTTT
jgi:hypothetical protein